MKDLDRFLAEKKKDTKKPHRVKKGEKNKDKQYISLMAKYKKLRRDPDKASEANGVLRKARALSRSGEVSEDCKIAACYI